MIIAYHSGIFSAVQNGPQVFASQLLRHLVEMRADDEFVSFVASTREHPLHLQSTQRIHPCIRARTVRFPREWWNKAQQKLSFPPMRWAVGRYDVYHQMWAASEPAVPNRKLVVTMYDTVALHYPQESNIDFASVKRLLNRAAAVMTLSQYSKSQIVETFGVAPARVHVSLAGCDFARFHNRYAPSDVAQTLAHFGVEKPYFLYVGGPSPRKNLVRLIESFQTAKRDGNLPHALVLAGTMSHAPADVKAAIAAAGDALRVLDYVPDNAIPHLYRGATALLFPSLFEGFGMPVIEAMACGTPVITSNVTSLPEVAGDAALMVDPTDKDEIARAILQMARENAAQREARIAQGLQRAQQFTWQKCAQIHSDVYDAVARNA